MTLILDDPRVLVCGWRRWPWPQTVAVTLEHLHSRYGDRLIIIEGAANGADHAAHTWCERRGWDDQRHCCYPVDWEAERRMRPEQWRVAGHERNTRMLVNERPGLIVAHHPVLDVQKGGTSDMCIRGLIADVPVWLVTGPEPERGRWVELGEFPERRVTRIRAELARAA
jgi:hypothetical protein